MKFTKEEIAQSLIERLRLLEQKNISFENLSCLLADHIIGLIELELKHYVETLNG